MWKTILNEVYDSASPPFVEWAVQTPDGRESNNEYFQELMNIIRFSLNCHIFEQCVLFLSEFCVYYKFYYIIYAFNERFMRFWWKITNLYPNGSKNPTVANIFKIWFWRQRWQIQQFEANGGEAKVYIIFQAAGHRFEKTSLKLGSVASLFSLYWTFFRFLISNPR